MKQSKDESLDELRLLRARLYKARAEGKSEVVLEEDPEEAKEKEEQKLIAAEQNEDLDLDRPVDPQAFEHLKAYRNKLKAQNIEWINKFKRAHRRDPTDRDLDEIKDDINDYNTSNHKYILMKAKMIRQGVIPADLVGKAKIAQQAVTPAGANAMQKAAARTGFAFGARTESPAPATVFGSTTGFQEAFLGDPSMKKLREDIQHKEKQNMELEDQIERLRHQLMDKVGADEAVEGLREEVNIKEAEMRGRDEQIEDLIAEKHDIEKEKQDLRKQIDQLKVEHLLQKNVSLKMKAGYRKTEPAGLRKQITGGLNDTSVDIGAEREKELSELQEQNEKLRQQVATLTELSRKTVYGGSFVKGPELQKEKSSDSLIKNFVSEQVPEGSTEEKATTPVLADAATGDDEDGTP